MCVFRSGPCVNAYIFINVDYQQAQDIQLVLVLCGYNVVVAMVTDIHFEYANWVVKFSEILFKNGKHGDSGVQHYIYSHKIY